MTPPRRVRSRFDGLTASGFPSAGNVRRGC
ncbi:hypothetical protein PSR1_03662 [Anaeromyxobacter sp. PSR-1]|nr:hypothetical protein PSR1_03662 [Anaeromyxobacter sp. PSR-1]